MSEIKKELNNWKILYLLDTQKAHYALLSSFFRSLNTESSEINSITLRILNQVQDDGE
jgi:hypothetical protein